MSWLFKLRHMEVFRALMLTGSTTQAGQTLHVSQPAISRTLAELEALLGTQLFFRRNGRLEPTPKAAWLFEASQDTLARVDHLDAILREIHRLPQRPLQIVANSAMAHGVMPEAVARFRAAHPDVPVSADVVTRRDNRRWLNDQDFDLALTMLPIDYPADMIEALPAANGLCILPKGHPLADTAAITVEMLADETLIALQSHSLTRYKLEQAFTSRGLRARVAVETETVASLVMYVAEGLGCAILDPFTARKMAPMGYVCRPLAPRIDFSYGIVLPMRGHAREETRFFADCIRRSHAEALTWQAAL